MVGRCQTGWHSSGKTATDTEFVLDANVLVEALIARDGMASIRLSGVPIGPPLLLSEARSVLHVAVRRGALEGVSARQALERMELGAVAVRDHPELGRQAWRIADELGWAKTYDAEYLALAHLLGAPLMTFDLRVRRAADRVGIALHEL